jgi:protein gp37
MARAPHLWILCTKRPNRARQFFEKRGCPPNFWLLTTVTSPATMPRIKELLRIQGPSVHGVSIEPLLVPITLSGWLAFKLFGFAGGGRIHLGLDWVIVGGESGLGARTMQPQWARGLRDECIATGVPFFFKQGFADWPDFRNAKLDGQEWHQMPEVRRG